VGVSSADRAYRRVIPGDRHSFTVSDLDPDATYSFQVRGGADDDQWWWCCPVFLSQIKIDDDDADDDDDDDDDVWKINPSTGQNKPLTTEQWTK